MIHIEFYKKNLFRDSCFFCVKSELFFVIRLE